MPVDGAESCQSVRRRLKPFLEDLLSEEEHDEVVDHLAVCYPCERYVRSIGDLSNLVWKLGKIEAPSDFADTVLFKIRYVPPAQASPPEKKPRKTVFFISLIFVLLAIILVAFYFNRHPRHFLAEIRQSDRVPTGALADQFRTPNVSLGTRSGQEGLFERAVENAAPPVEKAASAPVAEEKASDLVPPVPAAGEAKPEAPGTALQAQPLHWHVAKKRVEDEQGQAMFRQKFLDALSAADARTISQPSDLVLFDASPRAIRKTLQRLLPLAVEIQDYTAGLSSSSEDERPVSVYLESAGSPLHWHVARGQKPKFIEAVRESGGSVGFDGGGFAIFSISRGRMAELRMSLQSLRIRLTEFGAPPTKGAVLSDADVSVSVWFSP